MGLMVNINNSMVSGNTAKKTIIINCPQQNKSGRIEETDYAENKGRSVPNQCKDDSDNSYQHRCQAIAYVNTGYVFNCKGNKLFCVERYAV